MSKTTQWTLPRHKVVTAVVRQFLKPYIRWKYGITIEPFKEQVKDVDAVILKTGWSSHFGKEDFFSSFPGISESGVDWLIENGIRMVGLESPSVNAIRHQEIHTLLLEKGVVIVESLTNVDQIRKSYVRLFAVPLKLQGLDGSPVRAFAMEED